MVQKNSIIHQCYVILTDSVATYQDNWMLMSHESIQQRGSE